jgi:hypothetical protein
MRADSCHSNASTYRRFKLSRRPGVECAPAHTQTRHFAASEVAPQTKSSGNALAIETAKTLGLSIPQDLLVAANDVIE